MQDLNLFLNPKVFEIKTTLEVAKEMLQEIIDTAEEASPEIELLEYIISNADEEIEHFKISQRFDELPPATRARLFADLFCLNEMLFGFEDEEFDEEDEEFMDEEEEEIAFEEEDER